MMSSYAPLVPSPISTDLSPTLAFLSNSIYYYFNADPPYNNVIMGALLFTPTLLSPRLLLLQRGTYLRLLSPLFVPEVNRKTFSGTGLKTQFVY